MSFSEQGLDGNFKLSSACSLADSYDALLSPVKCGVTFNKSSSIIFSSFLFNENNWPFSIFLFFSMNTNGEFDGVFWECLLPLVEGSISSFELSGMINLRLGFLSWQLSILSSTASSFISFMSLILDGIILIVWAGLIKRGWIFGAVLLESSSSLSGSAKKSFGKIFLLIVFSVVVLYKYKIIIKIIRHFISYFWL